jgi:hypothetical protein
MCEFLSKWLDVDDLRSAFDFKSCIPTECYLVPYLWHFCTKLSIFPINEKWNKTESNYVLIDIRFNMGLLALSSGIRGPVTRKEAPRSQVQQVVYIDSKKLIGLKALSPLPKRLELSKFYVVWRQWSVIGFKKYSRPSPNGLELSKFYVVWRQWRSLVNRSLDHWSAPVAYSVSCKFDFIMTYVLPYRFWSRCMTNANAPRISENPASFLVTGPLHWSHLATSNSSIRGNWFFASDFILLQAFF